MNSITGFLQKFLNLEKSNNTKLLMIIEIIKKETGLDISKESLEIKGDNIKLNCNSVFRNEIFMHQSQIESHLKSQKIFLNII